MKKVVASTVHKAGKNYKCDNCKHKILKGEDYHKDEITGEKLCDCCFGIVPIESTETTGRNKNG